MISLGTSYTDLLQQHKQTVSQNSSKLAIQVRSQFTENCKVLCVPTGAGGQGILAVEEFFKNAAKQNYIVEDETVISRIQGPNSVVEESIITLNHNDQLDWLLPGVKPTKKQIIVSLVSIYQFTEQGLIDQKRVYWDQASVLRQAGVLPRSLFCRSNNSEVVLPILDSKIVDGLKGLQIDQTELLKRAIEPGFDEVEVQTPVEHYKPQPKSYPTAVPQGEEPKPSPRKAPSVDQSTGPSAGVPSGKSMSAADLISAGHLSRPTSRVLAPPGGISNIFADEPELKPPSKGAIKQKNVSNIFSEESVPVRKVKTLHFDSHIEEQESSPKAGRRQFSGKSNESHFSLAQEESGTQQRTYVRRDPNQQSQEQVERPSSRVLQRPGGKSNITF